MCQSAPIHPEERQLLVGLTVSQIPAAEYAGRYLPIQQALLHQGHNGCAPVVTPTELTITGNVLTVICVFDSDGGRRYDSLPYKREAVGSPSMTGSCTAAIWQA